MELGVAEPFLVDVAMAAQVILHRRRPALAPQAGDRAVVVGDRHVQAPAPGVTGDRLAQDMAATIPQRGGDPHHAFLVLLAWGADDLDDVRPALGQGPRLVEGQGAEPADLLEVFAAPDQDARSCRRRQSADDRHRRGDHQRARTGDHQHDQPPAEPFAPELQVPAVPDASADSTSGTSSMTSSDRPTTIGV